MRDFWLVIGLTERWQFARRLLRWHALFEFFEPVLYDNATLAKELKVERSSENGASARRVRPRGA
jgi:hypothetical protein